MLVESENFKKAIEKAVSASVRLCVVAPTVNVHVAEKKLKFKAGYVICFDKLFYCRMMLKIHNNNE